MFEKEPIITLKDLIIEDNSSPLSKRYNEAIDSCFKGNFKDKQKIISKYIDNDKTVLDRYVENNYFLLKKRILEGRKNCYNRKEIDKYVNTLDFQIKMIKSCDSHRDFLIKNFELSYSENKYKRREFNFDLYLDILDYLIEKIIYEQSEWERTIWKEQA